MILIYDKEWIVPREKEIYFSNAGIIDILYEQI